jgi:hypothetical protein
MCGKRSFSLREAIFSILLAPQASPTREHPTTEMKTRFQIMEPGLLLRRLISFHQSRSGSLSHMSGGPAIARASVSRKPMRAQQ